MSDQERPKSGTLYPRVICPECGQESVTIWQSDEDDSVGAGPDYDISTSCDCDVDLEAVIEDFHQQWLADTART